MGYFWKSVFNRKLIYLKFRTSQKISVDLIKVMSYLPNIWAATAVPKINVFATEWLLTGR